MLHDTIRILEGGEIINATIASGNTDPQNPTVGELFYRTDLESLRVFNGNEWVSVRDGGGSSGEFAAGPRGSVQISDGDGKFVAVALGEAGHVLTSNGMDPPTWEPVPVSGGTVTEIDISGGTTGLNFTGGPINVSGEFEMGGTLSIAHGGTGANDVDGIIRNILPDQTGHSSAALVTDGEGNLSWVVQPGTAYSAGVGLRLDSDTFHSTVADNTGTSNRVQVSNGDGTLSNLPAGTAGYVLTSNGEGANPSWENVSGTVSNITIQRNPTMGIYITGGEEKDPPVTGEREITTTGTISLTGILSVLHGGTGADSVVDARTNLLPSQSGQEGKFLTTNGSDVLWADPPSAVGTVTSVNVSGGDTGLTTSGGPITSSGSITLGGRLNVLHGGTGADNVIDARTNLLPSQAGHEGKILGTNGTDVAWVTSSAGSVTSVDINGGDTGLTFNGGPITSSGTISVSGVLQPDHGGTGGKLPIAYGGTGADTRTDALTNLLPPQTGQEGKILGTNGETATWVTASAGSVTSVNMSGGETGLMFSGGPITSSGTITLGGTLGIEHGGTGATTAEDAINALVPPQASHAGKVLATDGEAVSWQTIGAGSVTSVDISGSTTGLEFTGGPITSSGTLTLTGTLALANGGTGATSARDARNNILPPQATHAGQFLVTDGTDVSWSPVPGGGTVTSVQVSGGTTGLEFTGGPVTSEGTITMRGTLGIANGGTGATSRSSALNALLPSQEDNGGKVLRTNGTTPSWVDPAGGSNTQIQFNNNGALSGSPSLVFESNTLTAANIETTASAKLDGCVSGNVVTVAGSTIDCTAGNYFTKTISSETTWTFTGAPPAGNSYIFALCLTNGGTAIQTWPESVVWPGGIAPTLTSAGKDLLFFSTDDGGTTWKGSSLINYAS